MNKSNILVQAIVLATISYLDAKYKVLPQSAWKEVSQVRERSSNSYYEHYNKNSCLLKQIWYSFCKLLNRLPKFRIIKNRFGLIFVVGFSHNTTSHNLTIESLTRLMDDE